MATEKRNNTNCIRFDFVRSNDVKCITIFFARVPAETIRVTRSSLGRNARFRRITKYIISVDAASTRGSRLNQNNWFKRSYRMTKLSRFRSACRHNFGRHVYGRDSLWLNTYTCIGSVWIIKIKSVIRINAKQFNLSINKWTVLQIKF